MRHCTYAYLGGSWSKRNRENERNGLLRATWEAIYGFISESVPMRNKEVMMRRIRGEQLHAIRNQNELAGRRGSVQYESYLT